MKNERGVTLISITIYVIVMLILVAVIMVITNYFYQNVDYTTEELDFDKQYTNINSFFAEEANWRDNKILEIGEDESQKWVYFSSGNQYTYIEENSSLYRNNVKIGRNITSFNLSTQSKNRKTRIFSTN